MEFGPSCKLDVSSTFCVWANICFKFRCLPIHPIVISMPKESIRASKVWVFMGFLVVIGVTGYGLLNYYGLSFGDPIKLLNPNQQINVHGAKKISVEFEILARENVELTHIESSCDCVSFGILPQKFAKGERKKILADVDLTKIESLPAQRLFVFYTNPLCDRRPIAVIDFLDD